MEYNPLIFGKNPLERIVCIEPQDETAIIFTEDSNGNVHSQSIANRYWLLSHLPLNKHFVKLQGNLHYQYGIQFPTRDLFLKYKRIWKEEDTYSIYNSKEALMVKDGYTYFKGMNPKDVSILSSDIETNGLVQNSDSRIFLISNTFRKQGKIVKRLFCYDDYETDGDMLLDWCAWVREMNPSLLCGHNIETYDIPYLLHVAELNNIQLELGRDGSSLWLDSYESEFRKDQTTRYTYKRPHCFGREFVDTLFLAIQIDIVEKKYESYGLKKIAEQEGLMSSGRTFYDASQIRFNYQDPIEWEKIKAYCKDDADDALALFDLFSPATFISCNMVPKPFQLMVESATGSKINSLLVRAYLQDKHSIPKATQIEHFDGAISFGIPGIYSNMVKIDFASLYPNIIRSYEIYDEQKDPKGYFLELANYLTEERLKNKKLAKETGIAYYDYLQNSQKIFANSLYGFLGSPGLNFNSLEKAKLVTEKGRELLKLTILWATGIEYEIWQKKYNL